MPNFDFEGRPIPIEAGDSIAAALYRAGVRVFSRSFKYRRRRGLYCVTGDCPNCLMTVDGEPAVRTCATKARAGQRVARRPAWPSPDFDLMAGIRLFKRFLPVGFYYKMFHRPKGTWDRIEGFIRRMAGIGPVPLDLAPAKRERRTHHPDLLVVGGGATGLAAATEAAGAGQSVLLVEEGTIGEQIAAGAVRDAVLQLAAALRSRPEATILEEALAIGVYEGPMVPVAASDALHLVFPKRVVVATGAVEEHAVFDGSDLPGVWLGRGAARLAGVHRVLPGKRLVVAAGTPESFDHLATLRSAGAEIVAAVVPAALKDRVPPGIRAIVDGRVTAATGRGAVAEVTVEAGGRLERLACDGVVLSLGLVPRASLLRQAEGDRVIGAGDVTTPGAPLAAAMAAGRAAARGEKTPPAPAALPRPCQSGFVCLCEDVEAGDLKQAWTEGFQSTELLKRYSTVTMGPCQGSLCHAHLRSFVKDQGGDELRTRPTTARPPARPVRLEDVAAGARYPLEYHTALHDRQVAMGAVMEWAGAWKRADHFGDPVAEYWAVRRDVSVMDVSTLGKYRVAGPDAVEFLERLYPCHVGNLAPGRSRYAVMLNEAGYLFDDGLICALGPDGFYLTLTSGGADAAESWLRDWAETWNLRVQIANQSLSLGALNVAGPKARDLLARLTSDPIDGKSFPYSQHRWITVAGVRCLVLRVGFTGELSYELHHPRLEGPKLWDALFEAGRDLGIRPHGLGALRLLRLEKGHIIVNQDTDYDSTPAKLGLDWVVKLEKPTFVGRTALERIGQIPREKGLLSMTFAGPDTPADGAQLVGVDGTHLGYLTSSRFSPILGHGVALGWVRAIGGRWPDRVMAHDGAGRRFEGTVVQGPFYDPKGDRLRA
ncbi:MAG: 2Fe-2S iron-sulfur cluster-binding protein [Gemmatimonadales bacterium]|nr:2Fe-2S iron-sulfur cluster-binding protein [Gemmatimonadales bacterium]